MAKRELTSSYSIKQEWYMTGQVKEIAKKEEGDGDKKPPDPNQDTKQDPNDPNNPDKQNQNNSTDTVITLSDGTRIYVNGDGKVVIQPEQNDGSGNNVNGNTTQGPTYFTPEQAPPPKLETPKLVTP